MLYSYKTWRLTNRSKSALEAMEMDAIHIDLWAFHEERKSRNQKADDDNRFDNRWRRK